MKKQTSTKHKSSNKKLTLTPIVSRSKNCGAEKNILKDFHIETFDGEAYLNFFTQAKNKKGALKNLLKYSSDFKHLANEKNDWTIKVKTLK